MREKRPTKSRSGGMYFFTQPKSRSSYSPEVDLAQRYVTYWLNGGSKHPSDRKVERFSKASKLRIVSLLQLAQRAIDLSRLPAHSVKSGEVRCLRLAQDPFGVTRGEASMTLFPSIDAAMEPYAIYPTLSYHHGPRKWHVMRDLSPANKLPAGETMAAHGVIELVRNECLFRLRTCQCGRWYFAKREDGVACSTACRKHLHEQTEKAKETRRARYAKNKLYKTGLVFTAK